MKGAASIALYAAAALVLGGALAGPLHGVLSALGIAPADFSGFTLRLVQISALVGLWPLLRVLDLRGREAWGLTPGSGGRTFLAGVLRGFIVGALMMTGLIALLLALGVRGGGGHLGLLEWLPRLASFLATAVVVALIEEVWFRGALHSAFQRIGGVAVALFAVAAIYSSVHFIGTSPTFALSEIGIWSGFAVLGDALHAFPGTGVAGPAVALFAAGVLLGVVRHRTGSVALCIGMHAGWVLVNKAARALTVPEPDSPWSWLAAGYDGVVGWAAAALFLLVAMWCWRCLAPPSGIRRLDDGI